MLNNEKIREKCTEFSDSNDTEVCTKRQFAVTFGPQPWTLRCVLALDLQRVVHSELRCVIENSFLFGCAKHESARRSIRRNQFRWFIFNEDSYLSEAVKFLTGSIETVELICLFL